MCDDRLVPKWLRGYNKTGGVVWALSQQVRFDHVPAIRRFSPRIFSVHLLPSHYFAIFQGKNEKDGKCVSVH